MSHQGVNITKHQNYFTCSGVFSTYQTSKMGRFAELINSFYPLTNFAKCSILDVWQGFEYASDMAYNLRVSGSVVHTCAKVDTLHMVN